jgi:Fe-Mn family superoxide dismutase
MPHALPELPYAKDALAPRISPEAFSFHHGKHHNAYVNNLNTLLNGHPLADLPVEQLLARVAEIDASVRTKVFNNAAQHFNHSFYWKSLRPASASTPGGAFLAAVNKTFGSLDALKDAFTKESVGHFGSGWGWLVKEKDGSLKVVGTHDAGTPLTSGQVPLLTCDVWEHAYYIDYRNDRAAYLKNFWEIANWEFAEKNFLAK